MGISVDQLKRYVVTPTLHKIHLWSPSAENLLLGTAAQETHLGTYLAQLEGSALGIYQIEPTTLRDVWLNYIVHRPGLCSMIQNMLEYKPLGYTFEEFCFGPEFPTPLIYNLQYSTAIARLIYQRVPTLLPDADDIEGLAKYWKMHFNTPQGAGTEEEFINNYHTLVLGEK